MLLSKMRFDLLKPKPLVIKRQGTGSYVNHKWVKGVPQDLNTLTLFYPIAKNSTKQFLPEALRAKKWMHLFCNTELKDFQDGEVKQQADEFVFDGETYRIMKLGAWKDVSGYTGYEAYACKVDSEVLAVSGG